jgi:ATP/maltotriose-dependent transcriptional regulator MalT
MILLTTGLTNRELAAALRVSQSTVKRRLTRLYLALGVRGRQGAVARARVLGRSVSTAVPAASRRPRRAAVR